MDNNIRFIGGMWRLFDGKNIQSFISYDEALAYFQKAGEVVAWEEMFPQTTSDDIAIQMQAERSLK